MIGPTVAAAVHATIGAGEAVIRAMVGRDATEVNAGRRAKLYPEALVYELLDAHADTADLAAELWWHPRWAAHLDYLRALQRTGRETLAQIVEDQA